MDITTIYQRFTSCNGVTTDSRNCEKGTLFIALKGENFDGNAFAQDTLNKGCSFAIIDNPKFNNPQDERFILVDNCLETLQQLATYHRRQLGTPVIGITGTNGKTTTKELIAAVLKQKYNVLYTQGNLNNHIGVPLTLLRLTKEHNFAVIEMGANHPGEIKKLVHIAEPDYGIITNVGRAHLEGFGSLQGVIATKGELYDYLRNKPNHTVFIDNDNNFLKEISLGLHLVSYGKAVSKPPYPQIVGEVIDCNPYLRFSWHISDYTSEVQTQLIGAYNLENCLAAVTIGNHLGVSSQEINHAISSYTPCNNRSQFKKTEHNQLIIDAYNANPTSMMAALVNFSEMKVAHKMLILGDMKELGEESIAEHQKIVDYISQSNKFEKTWLIGSQFSRVDSTIPSFQTLDEAKEQLTKEKPTGFHILIKGSNSMKLYQIIDLL